MSELLSVDVEDYCAFAGIERRTAEQYRLTVRCYGEHLGRPATRPDLDSRLVNRWLAAVAEKWSACTARNRKRGLTPVWNWLAEQNLVPHYNPRSLRKIRVPSKPVQAWSLPNVQALLAGADDLKGRLKVGVPASTLMRAWVLLAYESGARPGDLYLFRREHFDGQTKLLRYAQHKTGVIHSVVLSDRTWSALAELWSQHEAETVFVLDRDGIRHWSKKLFAAAEPHGFTRRRGQALGTLRKTHGTEVCRVTGSAAAAARSLGHVSGDRVAIEHYIEPDVARPPQHVRALADALTQPNRPAGDRPRTRRSA